MRITGLAKEGVLIWDGGCGFMRGDVYRDNCGKQGSINTFGACPSGGTVVDTNNNATSFLFPKDLISQLEISCRGNRESSLAGKLCGKACVKRPSC